MSAWICPRCGGGFPKDGLVDDTACPWCHLMLPGRDGKEAANIRDMALNAEGDDQ